MAIVRHFASKNSNYGDVLDYMKYVHKEHGNKNKSGHYEPMLDENGLMIERENCEVLYVKSNGDLDDPEFFATDCYITNNKYGQNQTDTERKNHMYVLSFPPDDQDNLDMKKMKTIALKFARENFSGYQCLIGIHCDKDHYHIHFTINSCRDMKRDQQPYMALDADGKVKNSEVEAGLKHDDSPYLRRWLNDRALEICKEYDLFAKDMNKAADDKKKQKPDKNEMLRNEILEIAGRSVGVDDFIMKIKKAGIDYRIRKKDGVFTSFTAAGAKRATRMDKLGLTMNDLMKEIKKQQHDRDGRSANEQVMDSERKRKNNTGVWSSDER